MKYFTPALTPYELAEMIDNGDFPFQRKLYGEWMPSNPGISALEYVQTEDEIRIKPGFLSLFGLQPNQLPINPDNLCHDQITDGGKYRALTEGDWSEGYELPPTAQVWVSKEKTWVSGNGKTSFFYELLTFRVPVNTPFPNP